MRRPLAMLLIALLAAGVVAVATYRVTCLLCASRLSQPADELDWFRLEFRLTPAEMARIRALHAGYRPQCEFHCARIAAGERERAALVAAGAPPAAIAAQEQVIADARATCQAAMLQHFEAVSRAMPPEQGQRYLAEMRHVVLERHDEVEAEMTGLRRAAHGQD